MIVVTPDEAYALALIARKPEINADLVENLSPEVQPIGAALAGTSVEAERSPEVAELAGRLAAWARGETPASAAR